MELPGRRKRVRPEEIQQCREVQGVIVCCGKTTKIV